MPITPDQAVEILKYQGYEPEKIDSIDAFKTSFDTDFIRKDKVFSDKDIVNKVTGSKLGSVMTKVIGTLKAHGIELSKDEIKDKTVEEVAEIGMKKFSDISVGTIEDLKKKVGTTSDEQVKEWEKKYNLLDTKLKDTEKLKTDVSTEFDAFKGNIEKEKKLGKVKKYVEDALGGMKWAAGVSDLVKEGFQAKVFKNYQVQLDDKEEPFVSDLKGERIKSGKKAGEFKSLSEVLEDEGIKEKVYAINPPKTPPAKTPPANTTQETQQQSVFTHGRAARAAESV